jgi:replicative DNA helicase
MAENNPDSLVSKGDEKTQAPFGPNEEKAIISLAFDMPEFFSQVGRHMSHKFFKKIENAAAYAIIEECFKKDGTIPTREMALDIAASRLDTSADDFEATIETINRKSNYREVPTIKRTLLDWTRKQAYGLMYSDEALQAWERTDYKVLDEYYEQARRITDVSKPTYSFFDQIPQLFIDDTGERMTCGFPLLDAYINKGGPSRGEVFIWMAPVNRGKSIFLVHNGVKSVEAGRNVLHITLENSEKQTAHRYMGAFTHEKMSDHIANREKIEQKLFKVKDSTKGSLILIQFPPETITVDTIYQLLATLKRSRNWVADVVIVDYLELMISRSTYDNREDYDRQKKVAVQLRELAVNENVVVFTATQTNRDGLGGKGSQQGGDGKELIGMNKAAESYGKMMSADYVVSLNQDDEDEKPMGRFRLYIAKNRNGPAQNGAIPVNVRVVYDTMSARQEDLTA